MSSTLEKVLEFEAKSLREYFQKASLTGHGTSQEVSDRREGYFTRSLARYFPPPVSFAKGNIEDTLGRRSQSIDCIMLSPSHPKLVDEDGRMTCILSEGTDFAIEVKPDISSKKELIRGLQQGKSVKSLTRRRVGVLKSQRHSLHSMIPYAIYSEKSYPSVRSLLEKIVECYEEGFTPREHQVDLILVNNRFLAYNLCSIIPGFGASNGFVVAEIGSASFSLFVWFLHAWPKSEMSVSSSVLMPYFKMLPSNWTTFQDLNVRLASLG